MHVKNADASARMTRRGLIKTMGAAGGAVAMGVASTAIAEEAAGSAATDASAVSGTFTGVGAGRGGAIVVRVTLDAGKITDIEVVSENETPNVGTRPVEQFPALIIENQSLEIEPISAATLSSVAFLAAVSDALTQAGVDPASYAGPVEVPAPSMEAECDIAVIGSGGAGLAAAIRAAQAGKSVVVLEKTGVIGGTSNFTIESYGSVGDLTHVALGSPMDAATLAANLTEANPKGRQEAFEVFAQNNGAQADWLRSIGCEFTVAGAQNSVASSREVGPVGVAVIAALQAEAVKLGIDMRLNSAATALVMGDDGSVAGVEVTTPAGDYTLNAKAVIIAAGGYGASSEMRAKYNDMFADLGFSCCCGCTGDGINMAEAVGAQLENMDYVRVNFTYNMAPTGLYYMGSLFNTGAIFVNQAGQRFVNDQGGYGVGPTVVEQEGGTGWAIFDDSIVKPGGDVRGYAKLGLFVDADTIEELAEKCGIDAEGLAATVEAYKGYVAAGEDPEFGRAMLNMTFDEPPFHACQMTCQAQGTFGGIKCDVDAQCLDANDAPIPGLYAVGESASIGTYGANPASVNVVFGFIAGTNAAEYVG